jgi:hypothetical protein
VAATVASACSIDGCGKRVKGRGWCNTHYHNWWLHGDPLGARRVDNSLESRFWRKVIRGSGPDDCWLWVAAVDSNGYGEIANGGGGMRRAHRLSYEIAHGPIPRGMVLDHRCHVPACVNPGHLRLATTKTNAENRRGAQQNNKSGVRGVHRVGNRWHAQVQHHGEKFYVGRFDTIEAAGAAARAARKRLFTHNDADYGDGA